ncbi:hypothetical protein QMG61_00800 [Cryobacterium sp. PH31-AA6]|uniref:hypothetical protein n=1 Tax=Cryobacterium sp. PH31-AA6 TaxID=3046205 RepID=UPI0024BB7CC7|nr:hypothetical protein [Cryobacterium sp. PH31-AA6]MDJ0322303.1 hypothetical protein [Cryobacterium sp. PH31-AA6]
MTDAEVTDTQVLDRARCIRWMLIGAFVGIFAPIAGFLGGSTVSADRLVAGLEPLFVWLFVGMMVGGIGVVIGVIGALRWVKGKYHLE